MMRNSKKYLPLIIGMLILFPVFILPLIQTTINSYEHDHDEHDHDDHLQCSYIPCECGNPGCTGNIDTCPWELGRPYPAPTLYQPASPVDDGIIILTWTSSYGANSYKVYRSDAEFGTYTLIATTSSLSYTDTTTDGTWWYYVRAHNDNGDSAISNKIAVEVYFCAPTWYESNENYNIGDCPDNEWGTYYASGDDIEVVWASTYNVDMYGKAIRMYSAGSGYPVVMERFETFTIDTGESLYLTFKAQMNKEYADSEAIITLSGQGSGSPTFLEISFDSEYERIEFWIAGGQFMQYWDLIMNQVYDFDIMFLKDPNTTKMIYFIFIDQQLEFIKEVNTALYPVRSNVEFNMIGDGPGEFFLDNFFLRYVDNDISPKETVKTAFPMYFLYVPQYLPGTDHVVSMRMKYYYEHIVEQTLSFSLSLGLSVPGVIGIKVDVPIDYVIPLQGSDYKYYEAATTGEDVIIFYKITADISNITFYLQGIDPDSGVSEITGMYNYDFLDEHITSSSITAFEKDFGALPQEYYDCSRSGNAQIFDYRTITAGCTGHLERFYDIDHIVLDYSWVFKWGLSISVPICEYVHFDFGINFITECTNVYEARVSLGVEWDANTNETDKIQYDLYAPPEGTYSTSLDLAPYSVQQVVVPPAPTNCPHACGGVPKDYQH